MKSMLRNLILHLLVAGSFLISCSDDGDPQATVNNPPGITPPVNTNPVNILTVQVGSNRFVADSENWIFINTEDGELLDLKQVENGQTVNFTSAKDVAKFNVTWFEQKLNTFVSFPSEQSYNFITYLSISKGSELVLSNKPEVQQDTPSTGNVQLSISDYFESDIPIATLALSNGFYLPLSPNEITESMFVNNTFTANVPLIFDIGSSISSLFIAGYRGGTPVFAFPQGIAIDGSVNLNFNNFQEFDHVIDVAGAVDAAIVGRLDVGGTSRRYVLSGTSLLFNSIPTNSSKKIAYNDGFDSYNTVVIGSKFRYVKNGSAPSTFEMPQSAPTIEVLSNSMQDFDFTVSGPYTFFRTGWLKINFQDNSVTQWSIVGSPESRFSMNSIPPDLAAKFPALSLDLNFGKVTITNYLSDFTYADQLDRLFLFKEPEVEELFEFSTN